MGVLLVLLGSAALLLGLWVLVVGRLQWAHLRSRRGGALLAGGALVIIVTGSAITAPANSSKQAAAALPSPAGAPSTAPPPVSLTPTASRAVVTAASRATPRSVRPATSATSPAPVRATPARRVTATPAPVRRVIVAAAVAGPAAAALLALPVKGRAAKTGYSREAFGPAWADVIGDGCSTRDDILRRDLTRVTVTAGSGGCEVAGGVLADPYGGTTIDFTRGVETSTAVQIDHLVALSNAWQTGAARWTSQKREAFANDPLELLAVSGPLNEQKSDGDAATWLPPDKASRCDYVARQVAVKARYGLWVTAPERAAIARILATCPGQSEPTETAAAAPPPNPATAVAPRAAASPSAAPAPPTAAPAPAPAGLDPRFPTCRAANAAGYGPYTRGVDPEYAWYRDADHDGIDCER